MLLKVALPFALMIQPVNAEMLHRKVFAMGTELSISIEGNTRDQALLHSEATLKIIREAEDRLSTWRPTTELSRINLADANQEIQLSPALFADLKSAWECEKETDGAFSPALARLVEAWGLRTGGQYPSDTTWNQARMESGTGLFKLSDLNQRGPITLTKSNPRAGIEEGGFGKGAALDEAVHYLKKNGIKNATLNFGGQIATLQPGSTLVEIADPSDRSRTLITFTADTTSIATSGNSVHRNPVMVNGKKKSLGHLLNPFTGKPTDFEGSVTVLHADALKADCHTKVLVQGSKKALEWANRREAKILILSPAKKKGHWIAETSCAWTAPIKADFTKVTWKKQNHCSSTQRSNT
jgi:thiamine biosynthesis lipoprotein